MIENKPCDTCKEDRQIGNPYRQQTPCYNCRKWEEWIQYLIQKSTPKKPIGLKIVFKHIESASCPRCNYDFPDIGGVNEFYGEVEQYDYCPNCGQRIDWNGVM